MIVGTIRRRAYGLALAGALVGCGAPAATPPLAAQNSAARAKGALLYVANTVTSDLYVFSYPRGSLKRTLTTLVDPGGECVDKNGNVFVANSGASNIVEFAHGGASRIATLQDPGYFPIGCAIDPTTGNLAVSNNFAVSGGAGNVAIYKHAKGKPTGNYASAQFQQMLLCGYDPAGNLFVDGLSAGSSSEFAELPHGGTRLVNVVLNHSIRSPGAVQWDGTYLAIGDQSSNTIYQFVLNGKRGKVVGSTVLDGATQVFQFWIDGATVVGADAGAGNVKFWPYPAGGSATKTITGLYAPLGVTVSLGR